MTMDDNSWELGKTSVPPRRQEARHTFYFDDNDAGVPDEELPDLPTRYDESSYVPDDPAQDSVDEAAQDDFLNTDANLDEYLSYDEYEQ